ncbi:MAG TPA: hypothetical protein DEG69_22940 [Flavobacteriaceae bacterium]|nr:hypothetical protein [Flavobacteriaceae bacterium]
MKAIEEMLNLSHRVSQHVVGSEGNTSVRSGNYFYIKASGCSLNTLREDEIIKCDLNGNQINNFHLKPSLETCFHSLLYRKTNCNYIAHTNPVETLKILCTNRVAQFSKERIFPDQVVFNGVESCVVKYAHPGQELMRSIQESIDKFFYEKKHFPNLILLQSHGIICIGETVNKCVYSTDICEKAANIFLTNGINFLSQSQVSKIANDQREKYRASKN